MNAPCRLLFPVERVVNGPALLVEVGGGIRERHVARLRCARFEDQALKLTQVQIAVVLTTRTFIRQ